ncbi:GspE/PulE family protein [Nitrincola alkalisediminis]|uniref:GspE/PulE family protein n=1 Tax=Nitrincola alkalisediminis TaxID=1366656 RepID=UPI001876BAF1|nr:ATPase, T2SS/T4P/T4SS family [Nitrincola alkalisediminis]
MIEGRSEEVATGVATQSKLGERLLAKRLISASDVHRALQAQAEMGGLLGQVLVQLGLVDESIILETLSEQLALPYLRSHDFSDSRLELPAINLEFLAANRVVPVKYVQGQILFAASIPQDPFLQKALSLVYQKKVHLALAREQDIDRVLADYQQPNVDEEVLLHTHQYASDDEFVEHLKDLASEGPVIKIVNDFFNQALELGASDIHIEPFSDRLIVRYRVDGVIQESLSAPDVSLAPAIISRVKLLANLNIAERRLPQDGRIMLRIKGHELDLRVSSVPTVHGESLVMRLLDRQSIRLGLTDMGFSKHHLQRFQSLLERPHGILLVTGPTGSGKTTTLYAALNSLDCQSTKVLTVEDPVEYQLPGVNQIQVQPQIDLTFANALRSILRQDPDIIMIGEMRDSETAKIAVQSALTGHMVLSTLHTNTAAGAIVRLVDMGVEPYLITSSLNAILSQRLVRCLCPHCRVPVDSPDAQLAQVSEMRVTQFKSLGCEQCQGTGYKGRTAIHELLVLDGRLIEAVLAGRDASFIHEVAIEQGMLTLYEDGLHKVAAGVTSLEEVLRVTQDQMMDALI